MSRFRNLLDLVEDCQVRKCSAEDNLREALTTTLSFLAPRLEKFRELLVEEDEKYLYNMDMICGRPELFSIRLQDDEVILWGSWETSDCSIPVRYMDEDWDILMERDAAARGAERLEREASDLEARERAEYARLKTKYEV